MDSKAKVLGHPAHQILIVFPLGLLLTAVIFDIIYLVTGNLGFTSASYLMIGAGLIGALIAAPFGLADWLKIPPDTRAKRIGVMHAGANTVAAILFLISWLMRTEIPAEPTGLAVTLGIIGAAFLGVSGWLGGELIDRLGVGVYDDANLNAPSSLSGHTAGEGMRR